jgi:hypothetical protein
VHTHTQSINLLIPEFDVKTLRGRVPLPYKIIKNPTPKYNVRFLTEEGHPIDPQDHYGE